ncbi:hypothetical protein [Methyloglobulus sp.]|uniref:hypothetical protein n=1 Tax=Methyloglobulus sp. TaxID=2518622 RepID=UPI0032B7F3F1
MAVTLALTVLLIDNILVPFLIATFGKDHITVTTASFLTSRFVVLAAMVGGEILIRKYLWKIEHPELDFSGEWEGETVYKVAHIGVGPVPFSSHHKVKITQDCLSIKISPSTSESYVNWGSLALELEGGDTLRYAYWVNYSDSSKFPEKAKGYEEMKVTNRGEKDRPIQMTGEFHHCAQGMSPVYSGTVMFKRP